MKRIRRLTVVLALLVAAMGVQAPGSVAFAQEGGGQQTQAQNNDGFPWDLLGLLGLAGLAGLRRRDDRETTTRSGDTH